MIVLFLDHIDLFSYICISTLTPFVVHVPQSDVPDWFCFYYLFVIKIGINWKFAFSFTFESYVFMAMKTTPKESSNAYTFVLEFS